MAGVRKANQEATNSHGQTELLRPKEAKNSDAIFESFCDEFFVCCVSEL